VIKSGGNTPHGELYADYKPGGHKPYDGAEHYVTYRDINGQFGGPFIKDRLWYFTSFRDQYTELTTGMFDRPPQEGGTQGQPFTTRTTEYTIKLNQQLSGGGRATEQQGFAQAEFENTQQNEDEIRRHRAYYLWSLQPQRRRRQRDRQVGNRAHGFLGMPWHRAGEGDDDTNREDRRYEGAIKRHGCFVHKCPEDARLFTSLRSSKFSLSLMNRHHSAAP